jgi:uncharacterized cupin superfamily protein
MIIRLSTQPKGFGSTPDEIDPALFVVQPEVQHSHEYYADEALGLYIGVWDTVDMVEMPGPYGCDEFMWLIDGEAVIKNCKTGEVEKVKAGEAFIIPKGYDCQWQQVGYLRKFYVISEHPEEDTPEVPSYEGIIVPQAGLSVDAITAASPFLLESSDSSICYKDTTGRFLAGSWTSGAFKSRQRPMPYNEFAYVQSGSITLRDEKGTDYVFNMGEAFFIPESVVCSANVNDSVTLFFAIVQSR